MKHILTLLFGLSLTIQAATTFNFNGATTTNDSAGNPVITVAMPVPDTSISVQTNGGTLASGVSSVVLNFVNSSSGLAMSTNGYTMAGNIGYKVYSLSSYANSTNFAIDFNYPSQTLIAATNPVYLNYGTNTVADTELNVCLRVYAGNTNRDLWLASPWLYATNVLTTNYVLIPSNQWAYVAFQSVGTAPTNIAWGVVIMK